MPIALVTGRVLFSAIFIVSAFNHFSSQTIDYAANSGVPVPAILVPLSGIIAFIGGCCILLGWKARTGAWLITLFLIPVTLMMHNFWAIDDPATAQIQQIMFMKNCSMLGGALIVAHFGSGPLSLDKQATYK